MDPVEIEDCLEKIELGFREVIVHLPEKTGYRFKVMHKNALGEK